MAPMGKWAMQMHEEKMQEQALRNKIKANAKVMAPSYRESDDHDGRRGLHLADETVCYHEDYPCGGCGSAH